MRDELVRTRCSASHSSLIPHPSSLVKIVLYSCPMDSGRILKFDRTPVARLVSCAATFASAALFFDYLSRGAKEIEPLPIIGLLLLFFGTVAAAAIQYGDHIYVSDD